MFEQPLIKGKIFTDTMSGQYKSLDGNCYAQVFANKSFFAAAYPLEKKSLVGQGIMQFIVYFGVIDRLVCNGSKEHTSKGTDFMRRPHFIYVILFQLHPEYLVP